MMGNKIPSVLLEVGIALGRAIGRRAPRADVHSAVDILRCVVQKELHQRGEPPHAGGHQRLQPQPLLAARLHPVDAAAAALRARQGRPA